MATLHSPTPKPPLSTPLPHVPPPSIHSPPPLPPSITITPPTWTTLRAYRRLISLLLPIPYPASFYASSIPPSTHSIALLALWHDTPRSAPVVIAGIQGRIEPAPAPSSALDPAPRQTLYIQTLAVLAPYRRLGIAQALLSALLSRALAAHPGIESLYAHVWEANAEALAWYQRRGFVAEDLVAAYYRRLKPGGASLVRRTVGVGDWLGVVRGEEDGGGDREGDSR